MAPRANWKGHLAIGDLSCAVALYTAASTSDRAQFHIVNRKTGQRVRRQQVDSETGREVVSDDIVKGYEISDGSYVFLEPEEIAAAIPESDKTLRMTTVLACDDIDTTFFDRPYYLAPTDKAAAEVFSLIRDGLEKQKAAALATTVLFRRLHTLLIRPHEKGLIATTLNAHEEVRSANEVFADIPKVKINPEMLDLAKHIINTKTGTFKPEDYDDRYENAVAEMIKAKIEGRKIKKIAPPKETNVTDLMEALRQSVGSGAKAEKPKRKPAAKAKKTEPAARKKAS